MNVIELFAGCGGAALGLGAAGFKSLALVEWDADACATMRAAGHGPVIEGDVRDLASIDGARIPGQVDALWSSFPCQAWSQAGKRLGAKDERNGWPWTIAAIDHYRPRWFMGENVKGLTFHKRAAGCDRAGSHPDECPGCYLEGVILPNLRKRFEWVGYRVLNAADYGVPQKRERLIIVAGPRPLAWPEATHGPGAPRPWVSMGEALGLVVEDSEARQGNRTRSGGEPSRTVGTRGNTMVRIIDRPSPTVSATEAKGSTLYERTDGKPRFNRASCALHAATGRRRLAVEECAILQDFPPGYPWAGTKTSQYRQVGNAVPPRLAEVVGRAVVAADHLVESE